MTMIKQRTGFGCDGLVSGTVLHHVRPSDELSLLVPDALGLVHVETVDGRLRIVDLSAGERRTEERDTDKRPEGDRKQGKHYLHYFQSIHQLYSYSSTYRNRKLKFTRTATCVLVYRKKAGGRPTVTAR